MTREMFQRTEMLLGQEAMERLKNARVAIFGIGGVGGYVAEALVRCGVGALDIIDNDRVAESNLNRQIIATRSSLGRLKTEVMGERIREINPDCQVTLHTCFYLPETAEAFDFSSYSYVVDAIDTVTAKLDLVMQARAAGVPIISSMGTGNKLDPASLRITDLSKTAVCPLARVMRRELKKRGVEHMKVVCSEEMPIIPRLQENRENQEETASRRATPGSVSFVPSVAGLLLASEVVKDLIGNKGMIPG